MDGTKKDLQTPDAYTAAAVQQPTTPVVDTPEATHHGSEKSDAGDSGDSPSEEKLAADTESHENELTATKTNATDASVATVATNVEPQEKTWRQKLNPLRWGGIPPIPEERIRSREYGASLFSKLFFNWMTPLMTVRQC